MTASATVEDMFPTWWPKLRLTAFRYFPGLDAEALASETFLRAVQTPPAELTGAWLLHVMRNIATDKYRTRAVREHPLSIEGAGLEPFLESLACDEDGSTSETARARDQVDELLAALPPRDQQVLRLRYIEDLDIYETAARMGLTPGNVRVLCVRALNRCHSLASQSSTVNGEAKAKRPRVKKFASHRRRFVTAIASPEKSQETAGSEIG